MNNNKLTIRALAYKLKRYCVINNITVSVAESCTGGMIGAAITSISGCSAYFRGGIIAYSNDIKKDILAVSKLTLNKQGAVSAETVRAMAEAACRLFKTKCAISVSGIAGPRGGTKEKPVGLVYIGVCTPLGTKSIKCCFSGTRSQIRKQATRRALMELLVSVGITHH